MGGLSHHSPACRIIFHSIDFNFYIDYESDLNVNEPPPPYLPVHAKWSAHSRDSRFPRELLQSCTSTLMGTRAYMCTHVQLRGRARTHTHTHTRIKTSANRLSADLHHQPVRVGGEGAVGFSTADSSCHLPGDEALLAAARWNITQKK